MAFIGFKVAVMGPFGLVWVIITFMHDLRRQCRTRKTWLKFNHFLIYVFMQDLTMDGHEWNNAMRLGLVWCARSVQLLCRTRHIWEKREIHSPRQLVPDPGSLLEDVLFCSLFCVLYKCTRIIHFAIKMCFFKLHSSLSSAWVFLCFSATSEESCIFKDGSD